MSKDYRPPRNSSPKRELHRATERLSYVSDANRDLAIPGRSNVVTGGEIRSLRRRRKNGTEYAIRVRVGGDRSTAPAVATIFRHGRTIRVGAGESFNSPGALRV